MFSLRQNHLHVSSTSLALVFWLSLVARSLALSEESTSCPSESKMFQQSPGAQLLQTRSRRSVVEVESKIVCSQRGIGSQVPVKGSGYDVVAQTCCFDDMKDFIRRAALDMGLQVCSEGGLSGISPFFSCPSKPTSFMDLQAELNRSTEASGNKCHWLGSVGDVCTQPDPSCGVDPNPTGRTTLIKGFIGLQAAQNPNALVTTAAIADSIASLLTQHLGLPSGTILLTLGTGPIGGPSFLQMVSCTVFASFAIVQTVPPSLNTSSLSAVLAVVDLNKFQQEMSTVIVALAPDIGALNISSFKYCVVGGMCYDRSLANAITRGTATTASPAAPPAASPPPAGGRSTTEAATPRAIATTMISTTTTMTTMPPCTLNSCCRVKVYTGQCFKNSTKGCPIIDCGNGFCGHMNGHLSLDFKCGDEYLYFYFSSGVVMKARDHVQGATLKLPRFNLGTMAKTVADEPEGVECDAEAAPQAVKCGRDGQLA